MSDHDTFLDAIITDAADDPDPWLVAYGDWLDEQGLDAFPHLERAALLAVPAAVGG